MQENLTWYLPNLFLFEDYTMAIEEVSTALEIENPLKYVYGIIRCEWAFNYDSYVKIQDNKYIEDFIEKYKDINTVPIFNFSKINISEDALKDNFCNLMLDACAEVNGEVIVASETLFDYIKNKYPDIKITSSVNMPIYKFQKNSDYNIETELEYYNRLSKDFDKVIMRPEFVKYLEQDFLPNNKEKMIVISNNACIPNCQCYEECLNTKSVNFLCPKENMEKNGEFKNYIDKIEMLSKIQIKNLSQKGFNNYMLKDNKQYLASVLPLFNDCLFNIQDRFDIISKGIRDRIKFYWENPSYTFKLFPKRHLHFLQLSTQKFFDLGSDI